MASRRHTLPAFGAVTLFGPWAVYADDGWPSRTIVMITPASAGSGTDLLARALALRLTAVFKQQLIVDNRPGALAMEGKAPADGYTLLYANASNAVVASAVAKRLPDEINRVQASPEMATLMNSLNFTPPPIKTQAQFRDIVVNDLQVRKKIAADAPRVML